MALGALLLEDAADVPGVGDRALLFQPVLAGDQAPHRLGAGDRDSLVGEQFVESGLEFLLAGFFALVEVPETVIDATPVPDCSSRVEHEHLGRSLGSEQVGHPLLAVDEHRERHLELLDMLADIPGAVREIRVDTDHSHSLVGVVLLEVDQGGDIGIPDRTACSHEDGDDEPGVLEIGQGDLLAGVIGQDEVCDGLSDFLVVLFWFRVGGGLPGSVLGRCRR